MNERLVVNFRKLVELMRLKTNISVKSFEALNLDPKLLKGVYAMGFNNPSKIQEFSQHKQILKNNTHLDIFLNVNASL